MTSTRPEQGETLQQQRGPSMRKAERDYKKDTPMSLPRGLNGQQKCQGSDQASSEEGQKSTVTVHHGGNEGCGLSRSRTSPLYDRGEEQGHTLERIRHSQRRGWMTTPCSCLEGSLTLGVTLGSKMFGVVKTPEFRLAFSYVSQKPW